MQRFAAYEGAKPYIFVSYAHADKKTVYRIINDLNNEGYRLWYDEGIEIAGRYRAAINEHIENCEVFMVFVTEISMKRPDVIEECVYALSLHKKIIFVCLEAVDNNMIDAALRGAYVSNQRILWYEWSDAENNRKIREQFVDCIEKQRTSPDIEQAEYTSQLINNDIRASASDNNHRSADSSPIDKISTSSAPENRVYRGAFALGGLCLIIIALDKICVLIHGYSTLWFNVINIVFAIIAIVVFARKLSSLNNHSASTRFSVISTVFCLLGIIMYIVMVIMLSTSGILVDLMTVFWVSIVSINILGLILGIFAWSKGERAWYTFASILICTLQIIGNIR